jgi:hypothetical protein
MALRMNGSSSGAGNNRDIIGHRGKAGGHGIAVSIKAFQS